MTWLTRLIASTHSPAARRTRGAARGLRRAPGPVRDRQRRVDLGHRSSSGAGFRSADARCVAARARRRLRRHERRRPPTLIVFDPALRLCISPSAGEILKPLVRRHGIALVGARGDQRRRQGRDPRALALTLTICQTPYPHQYQPHSGQIRLAWCRPVDCTRAV